jgi:hypothetical protein
MSKQSTVNAITKSIERCVIEQAQFEGVYMSKAEARWLAQEIARDLHATRSTKRAKGAARRRNASK